MGRFHRVWLWMLLLAALAGSLIKLGVPWNLVQWYQLRYFTTLSNIFGALYAVYALRGGRSPLVRGTALMSLGLTGVVYHLLLAGVVEGFVPLTLDWWGNLLVHTIAPLLMAGEWLLFRGERLEWRYPLVWTVFPLTYVAVTLAVGKTGLVFPYTGSPYPYFFLNVDSLGWAGVLRYAAALSAAHLALGYGLVGLDRLRGPKKDR